MTFWRGLWNCRIEDLPKYLGHRWRLTVPWVVIGAAVWVALSRAWWEIILGWTGVAVGMLALFLHHQRWRRQAEQEARRRAVDKWEEQKRHARFN